MRQTRMETFIHSVMVQKLFNARALQTMLMLLLNLHTMFMCINKLRTHELYRTASYFLTAGAALMSGDCCYDIL